MRITLPDGVTFTPGEAVAVEPGKGRGSPKAPKPKRLGGAQVGPLSNPSYSSMGNSPAMPKGYYPVFSPPPRRPTPSPLIETSRDRDSPGAAFGDKRSPPTGGPPAFRPITSPVPAPDAAGGPFKERDGPPKERPTPSSPPDSAQGGKTGTERRDTGFFLPRRSLRNSPKPAPLAPSPPSRDP